LSFAAVALDTGELVLQFKIVLVLTLTDLVAFIGSALQTVDVPSDEIAQLPLIDKVLLLIVNADV
jgi:hypothetical protein